MSSKSVARGSTHAVERARVRQIAFTRWLGLVFVAGGGVAIALGWKGISDATTPDAQLPFLLSGGATGLALVIVGTGLIVMAQLRSDRMHEEARMLAAIQTLSRSAAPNEPEEPVGEAEANTPAADAPAADAPAADAPAPDVSTRDESQAEPLSAGSGA